MRHRRELQIGRATIAYGQACGANEKEISIAQALFDKAFWAALRALLTPKEGT